MAGIAYGKYFDLHELVASIRSYLPNFNEKKFLEAFDFAEKAHRGQIRKDGITPYIAHPMEVVKILTTIHADEDSLISAILHDVPEDTERTIEEVKEKFGDKVAFLVDGITKLSKVHYQNDMPQRQVESLKKMFLHTGEDLRVILIKLADRLHNMRTLGNVKEISKRMRIAGETLGIFVPIANLLGLQDFKSQLEDLCFKNLKPEEYEKLAKNRKETEKAREKISQGFMDVIQQSCKEDKIEIEIARKKKSLYSIYKKILAVGKTIDDLDHRIAIKIVVNDIPDCYRALGVVHNKFVPINDRFRDYIANPKNNGYQSLHTTVFGIGGVLTEIQIRSKKMEFEAEYGVAANFFEENKFASDEKRSRWVNRILEIEKNQKPYQNFLDDLKLDIFQDRIFVFTPKGEPIDLPKGATALDFAYAIHSDLGNHASKADVNGKINPISVDLKTGDVVKIIVLKTITPKLSWLSLVKTNLAKNKILEYFKKTRKDKKISEGHKMLQKELDIADLGLFEATNFKRLSAKISQEFGKKFKDKDQLFIAIAEAEIQTSSIVKIMEGSRYNKNLGKAVKITLKIVTKNRFGILREISEILYKNVLDIYSLKGWASRYEADAYFTTTILATDLEKVSQIFDELYQVDGVISVYRMSTRGMFTFYIGAFLTTLLWLIHPFILNVASKSLLTKLHPWMVDAVIYFGLLFLISMVLYMRTLAQNYFPLMRQKKLPWIISFTIPAVATGILLMELFYFHLELSLPAIFIEVLMIYAYLLMNYLSFRNANSTRQT